MFAAFWPFDFSFSGFLAVSLLMLWCLSLGVRDAAKGIKKTLEDENVQEAGKGILAAWLESRFKK